MKMIAHIERRNIEDRWEWHAPVDRPFGGVNYKAYAFFGNSRVPHRQLPPVTELRGLPKNYSPEVKSAFMAAGAHAFDPTWVYMSELFEFDYVTPLPEALQSPIDGQETYEDYLGDEFGEEMYRLVVEYGKFPDTFRIIIWFETEGD
jgi:hypothetical protein